MLYQDKSIFWIVLFLCGGLFWSKWMLNLPQRSCRWDCRIYMDLSYTWISLWISRWFPVESFVARLFGLLPIPAPESATGILQATIWLRPCCLMSGNDVSMEYVFWETCLQGFDKKNSLWFLVPFLKPFLGFCPVAYAGDVFGRWSETK